MILTHYRTNMPARCLWIAILFGALVASSYDTDVWAQVRSNSVATNASAEPQLNPIDELRNIVFNFEQKASHLGDKRFVLIIRYSQTSSKPDSQIVITRFGDGHSELLTQALSRHLSTYLPEDVPEESLTVEQLRAIATLITTEQGHFKRLPGNVEKVVRGFNDLRISPSLSDDLPLDGTRYDLWYFSSSQSLHMTEYSGTVGMTTESRQPIRWMNDLYRALNGASSSSLATAKPSPRN